MTETGEVLMYLLTVAWLLPLVGFVVEIYWLRWSHRLHQGAAYTAVACIGIGFLCSLSALIYWGNQTHWAALSEPEHHAHVASHDAEHHDSSAPHHDDAKAHAEAVHADTHAADDHAGGAHPTPAAPKYFSGTYYELARFSGLRISLDWYIDSLTLVMFTMVTFIATCIHLFAIGYMQEELTEEYEDHEVHLHNGGHFSRPGRFYRFFAYLSLFCFSMLGLVLAGNIFQVFIFWELVGLCSYLLIGFYIERKSASTAANKAFIMNRVGDFGFLIGMMILWTSFGTFQFGDRREGEHAEAGLFTMVRGTDGTLDVSDDGLQVHLRDAHGHRAEKDGLPLTISYSLLVAAGLGIFAGSIGKSAQFPLHTWLPDAMEGPTPVSALVHSATMVAAGVYLAGRFYPVFTPEVLLGIAYIGCITLFVAATIALVVTDIKRVLAYSTISQLGYMMLGIGVAGWGAGLFHLVTHAFFKSLMFLCSGSVIAGCHHEQDMRKMGGLRHKMKITAYTMLVGVIAIAGLAIPGTAIGFSGFYSKDAIVASALAYSELNPNHFLLFITPLVTAGITSFYMFRLWFMTFAGEPRDAHVYEHCHENPRIMTVPLIVLAVLAAACAWPGESGPLYRLITDSETVPAATRVVSAGASQVTLPSHHGHDSDVHHVHPMAGFLALVAAFVGMGLAYLLYVKKSVDPDQVRRQFSSVYDFLVNKWRFDTLYDVMFVAPVHVVAKWCVNFDRKVLDSILHGAAGLTVMVSKLDRKFDETFIDGLVNLVGSMTYTVGSSLKAVQTGHLRQYVMWIAVGVIVLFGALYTTIPK
ncbi:NADH-quinone oxidoreductase subunit L [Schlesneria sp.]|uniref:NADH-quinone oxidoreductase subunit L n=1 Tax=Schlesneria sp. TaxID=2762018 RepID=UPI002F0E943D